MGACAIELVKPKYDECRIAALLLPSAIEQIKLRSTVGGCNDETFLVLAENCLREKTYYRECDKEYLGRIRNAIMKEDVNILVTSGAMLGRLFCLASENVPVKLAPNESYQVDYEMFESLLTRALHNVKSLPSSELPLS